MIAGTEARIMPEVEELLFETVHSPPCGEDLTYDAEFTAIENAARDKPEQQFGDTVIPAAPPDWRDVEKRAITLLARTKDLRIAALLCRAWTRLRGVPGLAAGLQLVGELLERHGDTLHPLPEDGDDFMRANALASLDDVTGLLRDLRDAEFLNASFGGVSVREAEGIVRGSQASDAASRMTPDQLRLAVAEAARQTNVVLGAVDQAKQAAIRIRTAFELKSTGLLRVELGHLLGVLNTLGDLLPKNSPHSETQATADSATSQFEQAIEVRQKGPLNSRDDAISQLLQVADFIEQTEPTNPAPLLIRRAARLMRMSFMDILHELSPESVPQVETITGTRSAA